MIDKSKILFIGQSHAWESKYIRELGYEFKDSYMNHGTAFRILRELFFRLKLPGKSLFYNKEVISKNKTMIVGESLITHDYMKWLHRKCPTCRIILQYANLVDPRISPDGFSDEWCEKWTSDKNDAHKYGMHLYQGGGYMPQWKVTKESPEYDVFYIGKDKNRLDRLKRIKKTFDAYGFKSEFYITWERGWQKKNDGIHKPFLPYEGVLKYLGRTKAILHLVDGAQQGITIRIMESLIHKIKLITDDVDIVNCDYYNPNNIFVLGKDNIDCLRDFLDSPYEKVDSDIFNHIFFDQMVEELTK